MSGLAAAALWSFLAVGPNDGPLHAVLAAGSRDLPLAAVAPAVGRLWVVFHDRGEAPPAAYLAAEGNDLVMTALAAGGQGGERLLPGLRLPRLLLRRGWYGDERGPRPIPTLALDAAESLFGALLEARIDLGLPVAYRLEAEARAGVLFAEVPAAQRLAAYLEAVAGFVSHVLSVGHELARLVARGEAAGKDPCALADPPRLLFARWGEAFAAPDFRAFYRPEGAGPDAVATTKVGLEEEDKRWALRRLLGVEWTGEPRHDLPGLCPSP